jgi:hypothetical protein
MSYDYKSIAIFVLPVLLSLTMFILSAVSLGSVDKLNALDPDVKDARRSSQGVLSISVFALVVSAVVLYNNKGIFNPKPSFIYYF